MSTSPIEISQLAKLCNESLILGILRNERKHGYQLAIELETLSTGYFKFNHGTLYPILHKLESEKLVRGVWRLEGPKRKRKYYSITAKGRRNLKQRTEEWGLFYQHLTHILGEYES